MVKKVFAFVFVMMALVTAFGVITPQEASAKGGNGGGNNKGRARGAITAVDTSLNTVTITDRNGGSVTLNVTSATEIRKDSRRTNISALAFGDSVDARYDTTTMNAQRIDAKSPKVEGTITAVDLGAQSVTIQPLSGAAVTVFATALTKIERNDLHATLADFQVGDRGEARYNAATMQASKIEATGN